MACCYRGMFVLAPPTDLLWQQEGGLGGGGVMEHDRGQTPQTQIGYPPVSADSV